MDKNSTCAGCNAEMTEEFVINHGGMRCRMEQIWVSGKPGPRFGSVSK